jgi:hypothetical protein
VSHGSNLLGLLRPDAMARCCSAQKNCTRSAFPNSAVSTSAGLDRTAR